MNKSRKRILVLSLGYWFGAHSLGLLLHPYQSMRRLMREKIYQPLWLLPGVCLTFWWLGAIIVSRLGMVEEALGFSAAQGLGLLRWILAFVFVWGGMVLIIWQVVLGYLFIRFRKLS